jgi:fructose-1,6-bisphosphatase/inositol monophosphatase family enzyme
MEKNWIEIGREAVKSAIKILAKFKNVEVLKKGINVQTSADISSHNTIVNFLKEKNISCTIHSEESESLIKVGENPDDFLVIIDPLDCTQMFLRGEHFLCSVAMMVLDKDYNLICSIVGDISNGKIYSCDNSYAYLDDKQITISPKMTDRKLILGWAPYELRLRRLYDCFIDLTKEEYYLYNYGGQLQTVKIINGVYDVYVEVRPETLNEMCGAVIVQKAGGYVSTTKGEKLILKPNILQTLIVARDKETHSEILNKTINKDLS